MSVITVTATVEASNVPPRVRLNVSDTGSPAFSTVNITRLNPDGSTTPVRTTDGNPLPLSGNASRTVTDGVTNATTTVTSATAAFAAGDVGAGIVGGSIPANATIVTVTNATTVVISAAATASASGVSLTINRPGTGLVYDYEMQYGATVQYSSQETPGNVTTGVVVPEPRIWLVHPGVPALSVPVQLGAGSLVEETLSVTQGVFWPMGRTNAVVFGSGGRHGSQSTLNVITKTTTDYRALKALMADASTLLLNIPSGLDYGVDTSYISVGEVKPKRTTDKLPDTWRITSLPFVTVDRPAGGSQSQRTYTALLSYPSYSSLMATYPTYAALLAGP